GNASTAPTPRPTPRLSGGERGAGPVPCSAPAPVGRTPSALPDRNGAWLRLRLLRRGDLQHAVGERRLDVLGVRLLGEREAALERLLEPLLQEEGLLLRLLLGLARALDGERVIGDVHRELLLGEAGNLELDNVLVV